MVLKCNMKVLESIYINKKLQHKLPYFNEDESPHPRRGIENISRIVHKKKIKNHKKAKIYKYAQQPIVAFRLSGSCISKTIKSAKRHASMPELKKTTTSVQPRTRSFVAVPKKNAHLFHSKITVNLVSEQRYKEAYNPFFYPNQTKWKIYRCQITNPEDSYCCSCNSDAMFEVMKSLYDCYKKKNCDNCDCILCGHLQKEERRLGELRKSMGTILERTPSAKQRKDMVKKPEKLLDGKTQAEKEIILRDLAKSKHPLPEGKTLSEKAVVKKNRTELGLPPEPKTATEKAKLRNAEVAPKCVPLEGKTDEQKEKIKVQADMGIELPEGRTASEKALKEKVKAASGIPIGISPEKLQKARTAGLIRPLEGKSSDKNEKILKCLAIKGLPLPEGKTPSERKLIDKVRTDLGLPPEPKTKDLKDKHKRAANIGLLQPLEGKTTAQKEKILKDLHDMGIPLPEGRTASERSLIAKVKAGPRALSAALAPSEKMQKAKAAGLLVPLEGKPPAEKEKIIRGLAMAGIPLPEGKTASEKKLVDKVRADLGLPPEPKTASMRNKYAKAADAGLMQPLEGKSNKEKEKILKGLHDMGIPLPEGRTSSEKSLIAKVKAVPVLEKLSQTEKMQKAKAAGLLTPLEGKPPAEKEKIIRGLAMAGIPLPEGKTASEKKLVNKVRADLGLPPEPKTVSMRNKYAKAADAGLMQPLEGKSNKEKEKILKGLHDMGIPLPEGRTSSEKSQIAKVKAVPVLEKLSQTEKMQKAKAAGLLTPLEGKPPAEKEKIIRGLAMAGIPLPEGKTASEKKLVNKVRADLGLPPEPKTTSMRNKYAKAADAGLMQPLEGKSNKEKEKILKGLHDMGIPLPEGRTSSEKSLIAKVKAVPVLEKLAPSDKMRKAKAAGLITPLEGKTPEQKEKILRGRAMYGVPLPDGKTASDKKLINKVRTDLGLPPDPTTPEMKAKHAKAADAGFLKPLEGKTPKDKEKILRSLQNFGIPLPEGRTASEKSLIAKVKAQPQIISPSEKLKQAKAAGPLTPIEGKSPAEKEKILKGLAMKGIPLPEGKTVSEKKLVNKVRADLGLPPEPKTASMRNKYAKAADAGLMQPLEGKSNKEKEKILKGLHDMGIPLPEGRTASEKSLIAKVEAAPVLEKLAPSEKMRKAKAAGLITPLEGKTPDQKEKILKGLAMYGVPLPDGKTASEKKLINKVRADLGLPPEPTTPEMKAKHAKAASAGFLQPLEGKTPKEKEKILRSLQNLGIPLPEGRTASEKSLIAKVKAQPQMISPSEKLKQAKAAGLLTPTEGKSPAEKEKIFKGLAMKGMPLPEGKTASEKKLVDKVRADLGLPPEPKTQSMRNKHAKAANAGLMQPLEGKSAKEKQRILKGLAEMGIPLPEGRTASEKALISKIKSKAAASITTEKIRKAKAAGLLTPLADKTPEQREKILKGLAQADLPLPEGKTPSEKALINQVKKEFGIPERTPSDKLRKAKAAGLLTPLEDKLPAQKEKILRGRAAAGLPLPEGRSPSERALIQEIKDDTGYVTPSPSERLRKAKAAGLLTPLKGKSPAVKEKVLKNMLAAGVPIPEGETPSEKEMIKRVTAEPGPAKTLSQKLQQAKATGLITPLQGKIPEQKKKILKGLIKAGVPLPEPKTASDKNLIDQIRAEAGLPPEAKTASLKEKHRKAQASGLITPLEGKSPAEKEKILKKLQDAGIPLPEGRTALEKEMVKKIKAGMPAAKSPSEKLKAAKVAGLLTPLEGKTAVQKEKILKGLAKAGVPLPEGKTPSEKELINKVRKEIGLPPEPKTPSQKEKMRKAQVAGIITPLEGKSEAQKENILKALAKAGIPLPEGKTPSEKALIDKTKAETKPIISSEKLRKAKAAGLLTSLEGKSTAEKEKKLRGIAEQGLPLPEAKTPSEKKLLAKIRTELGLPPEPKTPSMKERYDKASAAGVLVPLKGLSTAEKEKVLKAQADLGLPLSAGRTPSEKALIAKVKAESKRSKLPPEKLRKAKPAGLLTPLEGKSAAEKEKIVRGIAEQGLPLPEAKTPSEKKLLAKIRTELGLPPEPKTPSMKERHDKASAAGVLVPLKGLSTAEKEKVLKAQADLGLPLSEGRTPSEKALIAKVIAESKRSKLPPEKLRKAKAAGLITPLEGKSAAEKEKIVRGLAEQGLPLPEAKTPSEKKLLAKIRTDIGLLPEPKTPSMKERHEKAAAAGVLVPLEGLSPAEKEKVLRSQADLCLPLPEGRTSSEKALIAKIKSEQEPSKIPSEKLRKAKAAGLLTPLEGKTAGEKEKIIRGLAEAGLPLPEGKTASEKSLIHKVKTELGLPPTAKTPSEKAVIRKAKADGLFTPLTGKTRTQKEKILKGLAEAGLPLPLSKTASEKQLIKKIRTEAGLTPEPSEKLGKIKTKSKKVGGVTSKKLSKGIAGVDYEDIIKTTKCDRGCGCDKKKIRFKHSYVKIRVTSPDISSLCSCPEECLPGVKAGAFIDNEGIKVTVGRAVGAPSYSGEHNSIPLTITNTTCDDSIFNCDTVSKDNKQIKTLFDSTCKTYKLPISNYEVRSFVSDIRSDKANYILHTKSSDKSNRSAVLLLPNNVSENDSYLYYSTPPYEGRAGEPSKFIETFRSFESSGTFYRETVSKDYTIMDNSSHSSFDSILVIKSETSLSLATNSSESMDTISVMSFAESSVTSNSSHYFGYQLSDDLFSNSFTEESDRSTNRIDYDTNGTVTSYNNKILPESSKFIDHIKVLERKSGTRKPQEYLVFRMSQTKLNRLQSNKDKKQKPKNGEPIVVINHLNSKRNIKIMVDELLSKNEFSGASSIFVVVPSDDNDAGNSSDSHNSTICIQMSESPNKWMKSTPVDPNISQRRNSTMSHGVKISAKGKKYLMEGLPTTVCPFHNRETMSDFNNRPVKHYKRNERTKNKLCQVTTPNEFVQIVENRYNVVSTDTTVDRPCCCPPKVPDYSDYSSNDRYVATNVISRQITPIFVNQGMNYDPILPGKGMDQQASFMSVDDRPIPVTTCRVPCNANHGDISMYKPAQELTKPTVPPPPQPCQCSPEKLRELLEQPDKARQNTTMNSIGCGGTPDQLRTPAQPVLPPAKLPHPTPPPTGQKVNCPSCSHQTHEDTCECSGQKRNLRFKSMCPCELHLPPESKGELGVKVGEISPGSLPCPTGPCDEASHLTTGITPYQTCMDKGERKAGPGNLALKDVMNCPGTCENNLLRRLGLRNRTDQVYPKWQTNQANPAGELSLIETGATYTQAANKQARFSSTIGTSTETRKDCACKDNHGNKKRKGICECPLPEPKPLPVPKITNEEFEWIDEAEVKKMKLGLPETTSGFKIKVKKLQPPAAQEELSLDDAIRYYASMKPELFRDIIMDQQKLREQRDRQDNHNKQKSKQNNPEVDCECPTKEPQLSITAPVRTAPFSSVPTEPEQAQSETTHEDEGPFRGLKFTMGGKGSGSPGLNGICCFDMFEESFTTW